MYGRSRHCAKLVKQGYNLPCGAEKNQKIAAIASQQSYTKNKTSNSKALSVSDVHVICNHKLSGFYQYSDTVKEPLLCGSCSVLGSHATAVQCAEWKYNKYNQSDINSQRLSRTVLNFGTHADHKYFSQRSPLLGYTSLLAQCHSDTNWVVLRSIHTTSLSLKEDVSKVEQTVQALKDEQKQTIAKKATTEAVATDTAATAAAPEPSSTQTPSTAKQAVESTTSAEQPTAVTTPKKTIWERVIAELKHYYHGFRLLFIDVRVCVRLLRSVLIGDSLSRRERNQLVRTTADLFRLVPFLVFIVVPFMEFLLPVALKLFPNMLPSTFQVENKQKEKRRKNLKGKLEMAKFLQDTIEEMALHRKGAKGEKVQEFSEFFTKIRTLGVQTSNEEILKYSKLFEDEITLDNLTYGQLRALCNLLELPTAVGTNNFLRFQLRMKLRQLEADDRMIQKEGVDSMAVWELQEACRNRGMRALGVPESRLKSQLTQWLDLHLSEKIPTSLLLLSRALYLPESLSTEAQLKATISVLPDTTGEEAKVKISEVSGDRMDNKAKLEVIQQEEEIIKQEKEEAKKEEQLAKAKEEIEEAAAAKEKEALASEPVTPPIVDPATSLQPRAEEILVDKAKVMEAGKEEAIEEVVPATKEQVVSSKELEEMEDILEHVAEESLQEKELEELKEDVEEYKENLEDLKEVVVATGGRVEDLQESKAAHRLSGIVNRMISQMDDVTSKLTEKKEALMVDIEKKERTAELIEDQQDRQEGLDIISEKKKDLLDINELLLAVRRLQKLPDDTRLQKVAEVLDEDNDGKIDINDARKVLELLGKENVMIKKDQMGSIMKLIRKEEMIEQEEKEEKKKEKIEKEQKQKDVTGEVLVDNAKDMSSDALTSEKKDTQKQ